MNLRDDRLTPHSIEAEEAVLGSVLIDPDALGEALPWLSGDDFFLVRHSWIWEAMITLYARHEPLEYLTVVAELEGRARLAEVGGAAYLLSLVNHTPSALNVQGYAQIVQRLATRRRLIEAAQQVARLAHSDDTDVESVLDQAQGAIGRVADRYVSSRSGAADARSLAGQAIDDAARWANDPREIRGHSTGFADLDREIGGIGRGLVLVAGRPGMGKSSLLEDMARAIAGSDGAVLIFSLEMSQEQCVRRMICQMAHLDSRQVVRGLAPDQLARYTAQADLLARLPITIEARGGLSVPVMQAIARSVERKRGALAAVIIDTANKVSTTIDDEGYKPMTRISHALAAWSVNSPYAIIPAVQLSRANTQRSDKRPSMSDLRDTGAWEEDADVILGLHREWYYDQSKPALAHDATLSILKNRDGKSEADISLFWERTWPGFQSSTRDRIDLDTLPPREPFIAGRDDPA